MVAHWRAVHAAEPANTTATQNLAGALDARAKKNWDGGRLDEAERDYEEAVALDSATTRVLGRFAAFLNNRAVGLLRQNRLAEARRYFERAESCLPKLGNAPIAVEIRTNVARSLIAEGDALLEAQELDQARARYQQALARLPGDAAALAALADLDYVTDQYAAALQGYERAQAAAAAAGLGNLRATFEQRVDTLRKEMAIEAGFVTIRDSLGRFEASFPRELPTGIVANVLQVLNEAWQKVGGDLDFHPRHPVRVKIYTRAQINAVQQIPPWVVGFFDGKLRLLEDRMMGGTAGLRGSILHEYTHAAIYLMAGEAVPSWLHEGLAQLEDPSRDPTPKDAQYLALRARTGLLAPLGEMEQPFAQNGSGDRLRLVYLQARSLVGFMIERYGWETIRQLLRETRRRRDFEAAFKTVYGITPAEMDEHWRKTILPSEKKNGNSALP